MDKLRWKSPTPDPFCTSTDGGSAFGSFSLGLTSADEAGPVLIVGPFLRLLTSILEPALDPFAFTGRVVIATEVTAYR